MSDRLASAVAELVAALAEAATPARSAPAVDLLTVPEFAARCGLARSTAWAAVASGEIRSVKIRGARRVPSTELDRLAAGRP